MLRQTMRIARDLPESSDLEKMRPCRRDHIDPVRKRVSERRAWFRNIRPITPRNG